MYGALRQDRIFLASCEASSARFIRAATTTNSSPPERETVSSSRTDAKSRGVPFRRVDEILVAREAAVEGGLDGDGIGQGRPRAAIDAHRDQRMGVAAIRTEPRRAAIAPSVPAVAAIQEALLLQTRRDIDRGDGRKRAGIPLG